MVDRAARAYIGQLYIRVLKAARSRIVFRADRARQAGILEF
jgi:hypothetical protein